MVSSVASARRICHACCTSDSVDGGRHVFYLGLLSSTALFVLIWSLIGGPPAGADPSITIGAAVAYAVLWLVRIVAVRVGGRRQPRSQRPSLAALTFGALWVQLTNPFRGLWAIFLPGRHRRRWGESASAAGWTECIIHFVWAVTFWVLLGTVAVPLLHP